MDLLTGKILGFVLVLSRVGAFFFVAPIFSLQVVPKKVKASVSVIVALFFAGINPYPAVTSPPPALQAGILIATETTYGVALGLVCVLLFSTVKLSARIAERQMGMTMANVLDPMTGEQSQSLSMLMEMIFILLFLSADGHHIFIKAIFQSYTNFPIGTVPQLEVMLQSVMIAGSTMLLLGLKMAGPILGAFLLMMIILAVMARIAPETNILFLSLPVRIGTGLLMVGIFFPFTANFFKVFVSYLDKLLPI